MPDLIKINANGTQEKYKGVEAPAGSTNAGDFAVYGSDGKLNAAAFPAGFGQDAVNATAGEALSAGDMVYFNSSGNVMKADATAIGKQARGYVNAAVTNAATAQVFFDDTNTGKTGLTPGATYYLGLTAGQIVTPAPTLAAGNICQEIGFATSATSLRVNIQEPIISN
jgi:hypothetical protein